MKKQVRKMTNRTAGYIFFYNLIMIAVMFGAIVIMTIAAMAGAGAEQAADRAVDALGQNMDALLGTLSIAGVCGGLLFLGIASCRTGLLRELFQKAQEERSVSEKISYESFQEIALWTVRGITIDWAGNGGAYPIEQTRPILSEFIRCLRIQA